MGCVVLAQIWPECEIQCQVSHHLPAFTVGVSALRDTVLPADAFSVGILSDCLDSRSSAYCFVTCTANFMLLLVVWQARITEALAANHLNSLSTV